MNCISVYVVVVICVLCGVISRNICILMFPSSGDVITAVDFTLSTDRFNIFVD